MKKILIIAAAALGLAGCSSYSELARWNGKSRINDGEAPVASFVCDNQSYQLFGCVPICTGVPLTRKHGTFKDNGWDHRVAWGEDLATVDGCLDTLRYALDECHTTRVCDLHWSTDSDWAWSLFLVRHKTVRLACTILPPKPTPTSVTAP